MSESPKVSPKRRQEIIDALRRGTVPRQGLDALATGLDHFQSTLEDELKTVKAGSGLFKAIRGEYGCGKTFFARWFAEHAKKNGFATAEVQVSETETPLHKLETVYPSHDGTPVYFGYQPRCVAKYHRRLVLCPRRRRVGWRHG